MHIEKGLKYIITRKRGSWYKKDCAAESTFEKACLQASLKGMLASMPFSGDNFATASF